MEIVGRRYHQDQDSVKTAREKKTFLFYIAFQVFLKRKYLYMELLYAI